MSERYGRTGTVVVVCAAMAVGGACNGSRDNGPLIAHERIVHAPPPERVPVTPLVPATSAHVAPPTHAAPIANAAVDARVLVITAAGTSAPFAAIETTLRYLGTPFDVLNATTGAALTADMLSSGMHGKYQALFLDEGDLSVNGTSAFTAAEWTILTTYEASFGARLVSLYTSPTADYGLSLNGSGFDPSTAPIRATCTTTGRSVFVGTNCNNPVNINQGFVYPASPTDAMTIPLLVDAAGNAYAATRSYADGHEVLVLTFAQASSYVSYLELAYGLVDWATRGLFVGERHTYAIPQIDDLFLASDIYTGGTFRITGSDLRAYANWLTATQAEPLTGGFRPAWAVNGAGSQTMPGDPLTTEARALGATFAWLNHTWDHADLTSLDYADTLSEFTRNDAYLKSLGLMPYETANAVTPGVSGLANPDAMLAIHDAGITQIVSDTSVAGENNPSPNAGILNPLQSAVLEIPRIPSELYFNVSQPSEWIPEYEATQSVANVDYATIIGTQSDALSSYMLNGNDDPWMFHQANTRNYDGAGHSLLSDLLDATFGKYEAVMTLPIVSPTMDDLAARVRNRMAFNVSGVVATVQSGTSITVSVASAATVPVTGLCTPGAESYAGQTISYLALNANQPMTYSLTSCNPTTGGTAGTGGMAGAGSAGGMGGTGVVTGAGGASGGAGMTGTGGIATGGTIGAGGATGAGGQSATGGMNGAAGQGGLGEGEGEGTGEGGTTSVSTGGKSGGTGGASQGATGGSGGNPGDSGVTPPPPPGTGCSCAFTDDAPGPGAFLFSLLGGGLLTGRRRPGKRQPSDRRPARGRASQKG